MALIQKIREKSALVLILMVLAIISFIAMLITQDSSPDGSGGLNRFSNTSTVVKVGGKELDIKDGRHAVIEQQPQVRAVFLGGGEGKVRCQPHQHHDEIRQPTHANTRPAR